MMDEKRLDEIRHILQHQDHLDGEYLADLLASHDAQSARIAELERPKTQFCELCEQNTRRVAELEGLVRRLTQCETNMTFLLNCIEKAQFNLPDYTLGTWQDRARGLAPAIATLRTRLDAIEKAATLALRALENISDAKVAEWDDWETAVRDSYPAYIKDIRNQAKHGFDTLAALLAEKGRK